MERVPSEAPTRGLSGLPRTELEPRAARPALHHVRKEQGRQRNAPQPHGLIHPAPGCRQPYHNAALCSPRSTRPHARLSSPARACSPKAPRAQPAINQPAASIQGMQSPRRPAETRAWSFWSEHLQRAGNCAALGAALPAG